MKKIVVLTAWIFFGLVTVAGAQTRGTGTILGQVTDPDGEALSGVRVTATSEALIGDQQVVTSDDGRYRLPLLPPGTYTLIFTREEFTTVRREGIVVGVQRTTTLDTKLEFASVRESLTVTAEAPLLDLRSTKRSSDYSDELRNRLPENRGQGFDLLSLAPEATPSGTSSTSGFSGFFGSPVSSNSFQADGVTITDTVTGQLFAIINTDWLEVVEITTTGASAEFGKGQGAVMNMVTKSGGDEFHGELGFFFQNDSLFGDNSDGIMNPISGGPPALASFEPFELDHRTDLSANIGGPVERGKLWFFAGYQRTDEEIRRSGIPFPSAIENDRFIGKLTWQLDADNRVIVGGFGDRLAVDGFPQSPTVSPEATFEAPSWNFTPHVSWNRILGDTTYFEVKWSGYYGGLEVLPVSEGPGSLDLLTGQQTGAFSTRLEQTLSRTNVQAHVSHFVGDWGGSHSFKFGVEYEPNTSDSQSRFGVNSQGVNLFYLPFSGIPFLALSQDPAVSRQTSSIDIATAYLQDDWTISGRLTLNLGIRFDHSEIGWIDASRDDAPSFADWSPRVGVNFDLLGDGRTSLHGFWGRFYEEAHGGAFTPYDPQQSTTLQLCNPEPTFSFCHGREDQLDFFTVDDDGTRWFQFNSSDPLTGFGIDPDLRNTYSDQITVGIDHQPAENLVIGMKYVRKRDRDLFGSQNISAEYRPVTATASNGEVVTFFTRVDPTGPTFLQLRNNPWRDLERNYDGFQAKLEKRLADDWSLIASLLVQKSEANFFVANDESGNSTSRNTDFQSPNAFIGAPGKLPNSRDWVFRLQGTYLFPDPLRLLLGAQVRAMGSGRFTRTERLSGPDNQQVTAPIEQMGATELETLAIVDLRGEKQFELSEQWGRLGVLVDVFNLFNANTVVNIRTQEPFYGDPLSVPTPREFRLALRWVF